MSHFPIPTIIVELNEGLLEDFTSNVPVHVITTDFDRNHQDPSEQSIIYPNGKAVAGILHSFMADEDPDFITEFVADNLDPEKDCIPGDASDMAKALGEIASALLAQSEGAKEDLFKQITDIAREKWIEQISDRIHAKAPNIASVTNDFDIGLTFVDGTKQSIPFRDNWDELVETTADGYNDAGGDEAAIQKVWAGWGVPDIKTIYADLSDLASTLDTATVSRHAFNTTIEDGDSAAT